MSESYSCAEALVWRTKMGFNHHIPRADLKDGHMSSPELLVQETSMAETRTTLTILPCILVLLLLLLEVTAPSSLWLQLKSGKQYYLQQELDHPNQ